MEIGHPNRVYVIEEAAQHQRWQNLMETYTWLGKEKQMIPGSFGAHWLRTIGQTRKA